MFVFSCHVFEVTLIKELWWDYSNRKEEVDLIPSSVAIQKVASKAELKCYNTFHFSSFWRRWFDKIDESCLVYYAHQAKLCQQNSYWNAWWSFWLVFFLVAPAVILSKSITVVTVEVGSPALLPCITFGNPIPVTQWTNATNGSIMAVFRQANASFLIANTRLRDGGVYVCSTSNEWGSDSHNVTLVVQGEWIVLPEWQARRREKRQDLWLVTYLVMSAQVETFVNFNTCGIYVKLKVAVIVNYFRTHSSSSDMKLAVPTGVPEALIRVAYSRQDIFVLPQRLFWMTCVCVSVCLCVCACVHACVRLFLSWQQHPPFHFHRSFSVELSVRLQQASSHTPWHAGLKRFHWRQQTYISPARATETLLWLQLWLFSPACWWLPQ